jgi:putative flippase GtrA
MQILFCNWLCGVKLYEPMMTVAKAQVASLVASLIDFATSIFLARVVGWWYLAASITGTVVGGIVNFTINRHWVFEAREKRVATQAFKYIVVWVGNLLLNAAGVYLITHYMKVNFVISKIIVSLLVGFFYNYLLQKKVVFKKD